MEIVPLEIEKRVLQDRLVCLCKQWSSKALEKYNPI